MFGLVAAGLQHQNFCHSIKVNHLGSSAKSWSNALLHAVM